MKKLFKVSILSVLLAIGINGYSQAPNVTKSTCNGGFSINRGIKIRLNCLMCCGGSQINTYLPIHKCTNINNYCDPAFINTPPYNYGPCVKCVEIWALPATAANPIRWKIVAPSINKYWIVSAYDGFSEFDSSGFEFDTTNILEGGIEGIDII